MVSDTQGPAGAQGMALGGVAERGNRFRSCAGVSSVLTPEKSVDVSVFLHKMLRVSVFVKCTVRMAGLNKGFVPHLGQSTCSETTL